MAGKVLMLIAYNEAYNEAHEAHEAYDKMTNVTMPRLVSSLFCTILIRYRYIM